jgi:hypothetical protein
MAELSEQEQAEQASATEAEAARVAAEAEQEQTVKFETYDKAMKTVAKRKEENDDLRAQLADLQKSQRETEKNIDPTKYQEVLESQLAESQQRFADLEVKFSTTLDERDKRDLDRTKLSAAWDLARKEGMVDDRDLLNFIDKDLIQVDENSVVNIKSVQTVVNKFKASKPYFFQAPTPESINDKAPDGSDDTDMSKLTLSQQLALKNN